MTDIVINIVKTLYIPDESYTDINVDTLSKLVPCLDNSIRYNILLIGWINSCIDRQYVVNCMKSIVKDRDNVKIFFEIMNENKGKLHILRRVNSYYDTPVLYIEHDIYPYRSDILQLDSVYKLFDDMDLYMVAFDQTGDARHNYDVYDTDIVQCNDIVYFDCDNLAVKNGYVATGCMMFRPSIVFDIYSDNRYGDEDYLIGNSIYVNNKKVYIVSIEMYHTFDNNVGYTEWKKKRIHDIFIKGISDGNDYWCTK